MRAASTRSTHLTSKQLMLTNEHPQDLLNWPLDTAAFYRLIASGEMPWRCLHHPGMSVTAALCDVRCFYERRQQIHVHVQLYMYVTSQCFVAFVLKMKNTKMDPVISSLLYMYLNQVIIYFG